MTFEQAMREAAIAAEEATYAAMREYHEGGVGDEPEITGVLMGELNAALRGNIGGLNWAATIVRNGSGAAAEEKRTGADLLIHVSLDTPTDSYSKGVLIQAKRAEPDEPISTSDLDRLQQQCNKMLSHTASAFVFTYARGSMRCGSATRFVGSSDRQIYRRCTWTSYRFFLELFRCPIGDPQISSRKVDDLPVPNIIYLKADGELQS
jgi:hypothetical protein